MYELTSRKIKIGLELFILSSSLNFIREGKEKGMSFLLVGLVLTATLVITIPTFKRVKVVKNNMSCLSIIIPARNEERNLTFLLESLQLQNATFEVIVVDDNSTDDTEMVAKAFGVKVVHPGALPAGWLGKSWACWNGAREAKGSVLLFLDADITIEKDGIEKVFFYYQQHGGCCQFIRIILLRSLMKCFLLYFTILRLHLLVLFISLRIGKVLLSVSDSACFAAQLPTFKAEDMKG